MILELFVALIGISLFMVWLGYKVDVPVYSTVGFFFVFLLSLVLIANQLEYQTGVTSTTVGDTTTITNTNSFYTDTSSHYIGYFLAVASAVGMFLSFFNTQKTGVRGG